MTANVPTREGLKYSWLFPAGFCVVFLATVVVITLSIVREPHGGGWDAWAIYGVHARSIFRGGNNWREGFSQLLWWSHPDYPLLLPLSSTRIWLYSGREVTFAQSILTALFTLATVGLLCSALSILRSRTQGFLAAIVLLGFTTFILYGSSAYADVPLMFFFIATFALFALQNELGLEDHRCLILAGVAMGLAAWTKNEGLLFVLAAMIAHLIITLGRKGRQAYLRQVLFVSLGLLPVLAIVLYFKTQIAPPSELVAAMGTQSLFGKLVDYHRYIYIVRAFWWEMIYYDGRGVGLTYLLPIYMVCVGAMLKHRSSLLQLSLTLCLMLAGIFWVYLTTPYDLAFHIRYSIDRVMLQLWPGFIFLYFLTALTPEESLNRNEGT